MPGKNLNAVKELRTRIPVGLSEAIRLMEATEGHIDQAFLLLKEKYLNIVMEKTGLAEDLVLPCLLRYHYDTEKTTDHLNEAFRLIDGIPRTETVYILERWHNYREHGLQKIAVIAEKEAGLKRDDDYWLPASELNKPGALYKCVIVLCEWLEYKDSEDLDHALHFHPELVTEQVQLLGLNNLAASLSFAGSIQREARLQAEKTHQEPIPRYHLTLDLLSADDDYQAAKQYIISQNDVLVDTLFQYVKDHSDQFP